MKSFGTIPEDLWHWVYYILMDGYIYDMSMIYLELDLVSIIVLDVGCETLYRKRI